MKQITIHCVMKLLTIHCQCIHDHLSLSPGHSEGARGALVRCNGAKQTLVVAKVSDAVAVRRCVCWDGPRDGRLTLSEQEVSLVPHESIICGEKKRVHNEISACVYITKFSIPCYIILYIYTHNHGLRENVRTDTQAHRHSD